MGEGWLGGGVGIYSREYGRLFWKNPFGRKLLVTSAPQCGFVTSLMRLKRLGEGIPGYSRLPFEIREQVTDQRGVHMGWIPQI